MSSSGRIRIAIIVFAVFVILTATVSHAQSMGAGAIFRFGQDARALGMGGAFVAIADDYSASYWNPAGVAIDNGTRLGAMYTRPYQVEGLNLSLISGKTMIGEIGFGGAYNSFSTSYLSSQEGTIQEIATYREELYSITTAAKFEGIGLIGGSVKYYSFIAPGGGVGDGKASAQGLGFDLGILHKLKDLPATVAISVLDFGNTSIRWKNTPTESVNKVPAVYKLGATYRWDSVNLIGAFGYDLTSSKYKGSDVIHVGLEYKPIPQLAVRAGAVKPEGNEISYTVGAGISIKSLNVDFAWVQNRTALAQVAEESVGDSIILSAEFTL